MLQARGWRRLYSGSSSGSASAGNSNAQHDEVKLLFFAGGGDTEEQGNSAIIPEPKKIWKSHFFGAEAEAADGNIAYEAQLVEALKPLLDVVKVPGALSIVRKRTVAYLED